MNNQTPSIMPHTCALTNNLKSEKLYTSEVASIYILGSENTINGLMCNHTHKLSKQGILLLLFFW